MAAKGYTSKTAVETYLGITISASLDAFILAAEKFIDKYTGRNFKADVNASARLYDGDGTSELLIDDCTAITKVEVGEDNYGSAFTEIAATGSDRYFAYPANAAADGVPINKLVLYARRWMEGMQNQRVTAKWGYSAAVPEDIAFAATVLLAGIYNASHEYGKEIKSESIGNYSVTYATDKGANSWSDYQHALATLDRYKRLNI